jgi:hypothetical protein
MLVDVKKELCGVRHGEGTAKMTGICKTTWFREANAIKIKRISSV